MSARLLAALRDVVSRCGEHPDDDWAHLVETLASALLNHFKPRAPPELEPDETYVLVVRVRATVRERSDSHGVCYELELDKRDFISDRILHVDADEIVDAEPI